MPVFLKLGYIVCTNLDTKTQTHNSLHWEKIAAQRDNGTLMKFANHFRTTNSLIRQVPSVLDLHLSKTFMLKDLYKDRYRCETSKRSKRFELWGVLYGISRCHQTIK